MTRFKHSTNLASPQKGKTLTVMAMEENSLNLLGQAATARMKHSIQLLLNADRNLRAVTAQGANPGARMDKLNEYAKTYFCKTLKDLNTVDIQTIQSVITLILTGLKADVTIKVGTSIAKDGRAVNGQISMTESSVFDQSKLKPHHNKANNPVTMVGYIAGVIKIEKAAFLDKDQGTIT
ncbi:hypothetical protein AB4144_42925, partial [Rhizobiaceae sp. 2RAB30]